MADFFFCGKMFVMPMSRSRSPLPINLIPLFPLVFPVSPPLASIFLARSLSTPGSRMGGRELSQNFMVLGDAKLLYHQKYRVPIFKQCNLKTIWGSNPYENTMWPSQSRFGDPDTPRPQGLTVSLALKNSLGTGLAFGSGRRAVGGT